ncbi:MAG: hypothetical protein ACD_75C02584G0002 [uncultured bacterium]|nr:MAG: hypothetical protein ACD_75C02584G0002 [uncultured bacterium]
MSHYDVIIIGAGPGGLACARVTAAHGLKTLVLERKETLGKKVCAGGITWNGLQKKVPVDISERQFCKQHIFTRWQSTWVSAPMPIIATVNREKLGREMAKEALQAGAEIRLGCQVTAVQQNSIQCMARKSGPADHFSCTYLVGADGSSSLVRRSLGLPVAAAGIGITYQLPGDYPEMEWHLDSSLFANGYAWVFPHRDSASIGAYVDARRMKASQLKANLVHWGSKRGYSLMQHKASAEFINFDFRGWRFADNTFLIGDAAGLASGLTGEGIYPAIVSGETVGRYIADPQVSIADLQNLIRNHRMHAKMVSVTGKNTILATLISELIAFSLKKKLLDFSVVEMAR